MSRGFDPTQARAQNGVAGAACPRVATLDFDVSRGFDPTQARAQNGVAGAACPRVATLDFDVSRGFDPTQARAQNGVAGAACPRDAGLAFDVSRGSDPTRAREQDGVAGAVCPRVATLDFDVSRGFDPTQARVQNGVAGAACPRVATLAFDVSRGSDPTQAREHNGVAGAACPRVATLAFDLSEAPIPLEPEHRTGWLGQHAPGLRRWPLTFQRVQSHSTPSTERGGWGRMPQEHGPLTCRRLSCGVAALHHSHPIPLDPEYRTGWLGQHAPGLRRWPLTFNRVPGTPYATPPALGQTQSRMAGQNGMWSGSGARQSSDADDVPPAESCDLPTWAHRRNVVSSSSSPQGKATRKRSL